ncbi:hypothetical protein JSQ81_10355 [Sporosarcina sp. Marseille-Q4063]|uniref:hypothetical protein n=1 Tax=Sporosarcina sp. Marseille-Q4063 TaxID=2810514 RepID=UPI001BAED91F|nr:hypothetical protein [Sporosarcina sp. Marseille-Q4063]QUW20281.1 hypothetical protein JSQ81_10355 [Sporosarcina sp. Marseille-Q4063]
MTLNRKRFIGLVCILTSALLLFGCINGNVTYEEGFPTEDTPALMEFMKSYLLNGDNELIKEDNAFIYSVKNHTEKLGKINYYKFTEVQLKKEYNRLFETNDVQASIKKLKENVTALHHPLSSEEARNLPSIEKVESNQLFNKNKRK